jgi:hypothetical protein
VSGSLGTGYTGTTQAVGAMRTLTIRLPDTGFGLSWHVSVSSQVPASVCRG